MLLLIWLQFGFNWGVTDYYVGTFVSEKASLKTGTELVPEPQCANKYDDKSPEIPWVQSSVHSVKAYGGAEKLH